MTKGVYNGQSYVQHRERMGVERAQRNAFYREGIKDFWAHVFDEMDWQIFVAQKHNHMHNTKHENHIQKTGY